MRSVSSGDFQRDPGDDIAAGRKRPAAPPDEDPLAALFARVHAKVEASGLTADEVQRELDAYNADGRD